MKKGRIQVSVMMRKWKWRDTAYRLQRTGFLLGVTLGVALLLSYSCRTRPPQSTQAPPVPIRPAEPPAEDLQTKYRTVLQGDTIDKQRESFRLGYHFLQEKNYAAARLFFSRTVETYPPLADYSLYFLGVLSREEGRNDEAQTFFTRLLVEHPQSIWASQAALELATLALSQKNWGEASQYAQQARTGYKMRPSTRQRAALLLAQAREGQGDVASAYNQYQEVRRSAPSSPAGKIAKEQVERLRATAPDRFALRTDEEYLSEIRLRSQEGDSAGVEVLSAQLSTQFPNSPLQPEALSLLAITYKKQGRVDDAIRTQQEIADRYPSSNAASTALFRGATLLWNADRNDEALVVFERITQQYPRHSKAAEAWYSIGRIYQERKDEAHATAAFERLATLFPGTQLAREGRWRQAWMAYRRQDFSLAEARFSALARSAGNTAEGESAFYWHARTLEQQAQLDQAAQQYRQILQRSPESYYAFWAEKRLGVSPSPLLISSEEIPVSPPSMSPIAEGHYRRSLELRAIGLSGFARQELDIVREQTSHNDDSALFFLSEYSHVEGHHAALRLAQSLGREGGNWSRYLFPQAYWETVSAQAEGKRLDPYLVLAVMRQESVFDPDAVSPAQACGLMQLLPTTAARVTGVSPGTSLPLTEPQFNIETGTIYLRQLLDRYHDNFILSVAAYNSGENAVDRWLKRYPGLAQDEFVEHISYRETRNYVKQVLRNYRTYLRLYAAGSIPEVKDSYTLLQKDHHLDRLY